MKTIPPAFARLTHLDIPLLQSKHVTIIGLGGGTAALIGLGRQGVGSFDIIDHDTVSKTNPGRQDHDDADVDRPKVFAARDKLLRAIPTAKVTCHERNVCDLSESELAQLAARSDLFYIAIDNNKPLSLLNRLCLLHGIPFVASGMYEQGYAGELYFWHQGLYSCMRCMLPNRFEETEEPPPLSDAASFSDVQKLDGAGVDLALGLLTFPDDRPLSRQIKALGSRNLLQMKFRHDYKWEGRDVIAECLGIPKDNDAYFTFCTAARRDPDQGGRCSDCAAFRTLGSDGLPELDSTWTRHLYEWKHS